MSKKHSPRFLALVDAAKETVSEVSVEDVLRWRAEGRAFALVDVREESEWAADHAAGAVYLGKGVIERDIEAHYEDPQSCLVLYCGGGFRSALAARALMDMGYSDVHSLAGGIRAWREANAPLED